MKITHFKIKFPRKKKKQLKKVGQHPQFVYEAEIENKNTARLSTILFGKSQ